MVGRQDKWRARCAEESLESLREELKGGKRRRAAVDDEAVALASDYDELDSGERA